MSPPSKSNPRIPCNRLGMSPLKIPLRLQLQPQHGCRCDAQARSSLLLLLRNRPSSLHNRLSCQPPRSLAQGLSENRLSSRILLYLPRRTFPVLRCHHSEQTAAARHTSKSLWPPNGCSIRSLCLMTKTPSRLSANLLYNGHRLLQAKVSACIAPLWHFLLRMLKSSGLALRHTTYSIAGKMASALQEWGNPAGPRRRATRHRR